MNNRIELVDPAEEIQTKALLPIQTAQALQVTSEAELEDAGRIIRILKDLQDEVNRVFKPIVDQAFKAHKAAKTAQNDHLQPLLEAEQAVRYRMNLFLSAQKAEREKAEAERRKAEEHLRQQPTVIATDRKLGVTEVAGQSIFPPRLPEVPPPPKAAGISEQKEWKWKVFDITQIPAEYWTLDEALISSVVRQKKERTDIPGIEIFSESRAVVKR